MEENDKSVVQQLLEEKKGREAAEAKLEALEQDKKIQEGVREKATRIVEEYKGLVDTREKEIAEAVTAEVKRQLPEYQASVLGDMRWAPKLEFPIEHRTGNLSKAEKQFMTLALNPGLKAMDTSTAAAGGTFVATELATQIIDMVRVQNLLLPQLTVIENMPSETYDVPLISADPTPYYVTQNAAPTASNPTTGKITLSAKKIAAEIDFSSELTADSVVPLIPTLTANLATTISDTIERVVVFGDDTTTAASNIDKNVGAGPPADPQLAMNGLWYKAKNGTGTWFAAYGTDWPTSFRAGRAAMDKYAVNPNDLIYLAPVYVVNKCVTNAGFTTWDKVGPNASALIGTLPNPSAVAPYGFFDGSPMIATAWLYKTDANGVRLTTAGSNTKYSGMVLRKKAIWVGFRGTLEIETDKDIQKDQIQMVARRRMALQIAHGDASNNNTSGCIYGIYNGS